MIKWVKIVTPQGEIKEVYGTQNVTENDNILYMFTHENENFHYVGKINTSVD